MGLTASSTGGNVLQEDIFEKAIGCNFTIAIAGNPNVGKSTVFNGLTGMHQHTGNWPGKTVSNAVGKCHFQDKDFLLVDIPGTYSLMSHSEEEEIARNYICFGNPDATVVILDATCLERNLNLVFQTFEITKNVIVCVNLLDEAKKKGIHIDLDLLSKYLGVPVVGTTARKPKTLTKLMETVYEVCMGNITCEPKVVTYFPAIEDAISLLIPELQKTKNKKDYLYRWIALKLLDGEATILSSIEEHLHIVLQENETLQLKLEEANCLLQKNDISKTNFRDKVVSSIVFKAEDFCNDVCQFDKISYNQRDRKIDKILTSKKFGIPIMLLFLGLIFWITITGANYPSQLLSQFFGMIQEQLLVFFECIRVPAWLTGLLVNGMYQTLAWVISVMLPPMAIFFPMFTIMEDLGYLPRIAFNLDNFFKKACASGKQALTMCMGFGCNAAGVIGCRIIDSPRERLIAILTNAFVPCNRKISFFDYGSNYFYIRSRGKFWSFFAFYFSCFTCYPFRNFYDLTCV